MKSNFTTSVFSGILLFCGMQMAQAQSSIGFYQSNRNASYTSLQNPSQTYPDKNRVYLNVWGYNLGFQTNALRYNAPFSLINWAVNNVPEEYQDPQGRVKFGQDWLGLGTQSGPAKFYYLNEVFAPSMQFRIDRNEAIGFGVKSVSGISIDGLTSEFARMFRYGADSTALFGNGALNPGQNYNNKRFAFNAESYLDMYFQYARVTRDRGNHFMKWGFTGKFLLGLGAAHLSGRDVSANLNSSATQLTLNSGTQLKYLHTPDNTVMDPLNSPMGLKLQEVSGAGLGLDIGFTYEFRPGNKRRTINDGWEYCFEEKNNDYLFRLGASITDFGFIYYGNGEGRKLNLGQNVNYQINKNLVDNYNYSPFLGNDRFAQPDTGFFDKVGAGATGAFATTTPLAFNAQFDLNFGGGFYLGAQWVQNLKGKGGVGLKRSSYFSAVPRWEVEHAEIGLPLTMTQDYTRFAVGLYGRLGPFILGTDDLAGLSKTLVNASNFSSGNIYGGLRFKIRNCEPYVDFTEYRRDTVKQYDTLNQKFRDTVKFWDTVRIKEKDTVIIRDTVKIEKRDTVIKYKNGEASPDLKKKEEELAKKEALLKQQEALLRQKEEELLKRESTNMGSSNACCTKASELEAQLKRERESYTRLETMYNQELAERKRQQAKVAELEGKVTVLNNEITSLKNERTNLQLEIDRLKSELAKCKIGSTGSVSSQVKSLDSLLTIEKNNSAEWRKKYEATKAQYEVISAENEKNKKRIAELELLAAKLQTCETQMATLKAQLEQEKQDHNQTKSKLSVLQQEYNLLLEERNKLKEDLKNCGTGSSATDKAKIAELEKQLGEEKAKTESANKSKAQVEVENNTLKTENQKLKEEKAALQAELEKFKSENSTLKAQIADLEAKLKDCGNSAELSQMKKELEDLKAKYQVLDGQYKQMKANYDQMKLDYADCQKKVADLEAKLKNCSGEDCSSVKEQLENEKAKSQSLQNQYNAIKEEYNLMMDERNSLKDKVKDLEAKLSACQNGSNEIENLKSKISQLETQIASKEGEIANLKKENATLKSNNTNLNNRVKALEEENANLQSQLADAQRQLEECKRTNGGNNGGGVFKPEQGNTGGGLRNIPRTGTGTGTGTVPGGSGRR